MRVRDVMTSEVIAVPADMTVPEIAEHLLRSRVSGAPVLNGKGRVVGVVSERDLVARLAPGGADRRRSTASHVMTRPAVTVEAERSVSHAATLMLGRRIRRLPVLEHGRLVGIVTRADVVRAFARDDDAIAQEIRSDVILRRVFVDPRRVEVKVEAGAVELTGEVETRGKAQRLVDYVEHVPGVTSVRSEVTWRRDDRPPKGVPPADRT